jgi:hypothetical protein
MLFLLGINFSIRNRFGKTTKGIPAEEPASSKAPEKIPAKSSSLGPQGKSVTAPSQQLQASKSNSPAKHKPDQEMLE